MPPYLGHWMNKLEQLSYSVGVSGQLFWRQWKILQLIHIRLQKRITYCHMMMNILQSHRGRWGFCPWKIIKAITQSKRLFKENRIKTTSNGKDRHAEVVMSKCMKIKWTWNVLNHSHMPSRKGKRADIMTKRHKKSPEIWFKCTHHRHLMEAIQTR